MKYLKKTEENGIIIQKLDNPSLHLLVYADASFANNSDLTSQLGYIILLADKFGKRNILHYASYKSRRVTRSVLGAEVYAFADAFDYAYVIRHDLEEILNQCIPLQIMTDSRSLFDVIVRNSTTSDRRLMIDIKDVRESYESQKISHVGFVRSKTTLQTHSQNPNIVMHLKGSCVLEQLIFMLMNGLFDSQVRKIQPHLSNESRGSVNPIMPTYLFIACHACSIFDLYNLCKENSPIVLCYFIPMMSPKYPYFATSSQLPECDSSVYITQLHSCDVTRVI